jgi:hypothetical protein
MNSTNGHNDNHEAGGYEKRDVNALKVILFGVGGIVLLAFLLITLVSYFGMTKEQMVYDAVLRPESTPLRELRARETIELEMYGIIDSTKGIYRIPIKRAMELVSEEASQTQALRAKGKAK